MCVLRKKFCDGCLTHFKISVRKQSTKFLSTIRVNIFLWILLTFFFFFSFSLRRKYFACGLMRCSCRIYRIKPFLKQYLSNMFLVRNSLQIELLTTCILQCFLSLFYFHLVWIKFLYRIYFPVHHRIVIDERKCVFAHNICLWITICCDLLMAKVEWSRVKLVNLYSKLIYCPLSFCIA